MIPMLKAVALLIWGSVLVCGAQGDDWKTEFESGCGSRAPARVLLLQSGAGLESAVCGLEGQSARQARLNNRFLIASLSKTYLATAALVLQDEGRLSIDDPAARWLSGDIVALFGELNGITLGHLLAMTSGLPDYLDDGFYEDALVLSAQGKSGAEILDMALRSAAREPRSFPAGADFEYSNTNYLVAQLVLEAAAHQTLDEIYRTRIFSPAGLTSTGLLGYSAGLQDLVSGYEADGAALADVSRYHAIPGMGDGGLVATAGDVLAFYDALFVRRTLLSEKGLAQMLQDPLGASYGLGIEVERLDDGDLLVGHSGGDMGFSGDVRHRLGRAETAVYLSAFGDDEDISWPVELLDPE